MEKQMKEVFETGKFLRVGNNLSVDFVNTRIAQNGAPLDLIEDFHDLTAWTIAADLLEKSQAEKLFNDWKNRSEAKETFERAMNFREILLEMLANLANGKPIKTKTIAAINREIQNQSGALEIRKSGEGFEKIFRADFREPRQILAPVASGAADLLVYANPSHIRKCENETCVLYFYDTTKNHSRRWCSMKACGNRAKAAAFYQRAKFATKGKKNGG